MKQIRHYVGTAIIVAVLTMGIGLWLRQVLARMPLGSSTQSAPILDLLGMHFWAIAFLFSLIAGVMLYSFIFFRQKKGEMKDGDHIEGNTPLEIIWTIIPTGVVIYFSFLGGQALGAIEATSPDALRVNVTGQQWSWNFEYPEAGISSDTLVLPVNRQVLFRLRSVDTLHSFWVAEFGPKQDLVPGGIVQELRITPTEIGEYKLRCAELCGAQHSTMLSDVLVLSQEEYDAWVLDEQQIDPCSLGDLVGCGEKLYTEAGCFACHTLDGTDNPIGPTWAGLWGTEHEHTDGSVSIVDADHIYDAIREPGAQIMAGRLDAMPADIGANLTDDDIAAITAFIESLK